MKRTLPAGVALRITSRCLACGGRGSVTRYPTVPEFRFVNPANLAQLPCLSCHGCGETTWDIQERAPLAA